MELKGEDFFVRYNQSVNAIEFSGTLRLRDSSEYQGLSDLLDQAYSESQSPLTLDFKNLKFLNSSGINTISKFVINARKNEKSDLKIMGNNEISWQQKSLINLQKLWPKVTIEID